MSTDQTASDKAALRTTMARLRAQAQARGGVSQATFHLVRLLGDRPPGTLSAYWPMRSELDPRPA
ncbi:MAG: 5-formyltetrahydrofolate cyclo-ligase, partial [Pseudomonadota bacterium]